MRTHKSRPKIRVVYIGGAEHNGSTFLGLSLGNHPQIECVGELTSLAREGWLDHYPCACGTQISDCYFWSDVRTKWENLVNNEVRVLAELENSFDRNRHLPKLILEKFIHSKKFSTYSENIYALYQAIHQTSNNSIIVDTSKRFSRAFALSMVEGIDLRIIHLVRDARGVAYSWSKPKRPKQRTWFDSSLRWVVANIAFEFLRLVLSSQRVMCVRYESFIGNPIDTLNNIGKFIDVDLKSLAVSLSKGHNLKKMHIGIGNGFLQGIKDIRLNTNITWPEMITPKEQRKIWRLTKPLMRHYGYEF